MRTKIFPLIVKKRSCQHRRERGGLKVCVEILTRVTNVNKTKRMLTIMRSRSRKRNKIRVLRDLEIDGGNAWGCHYARI